MSKSILTKNIEAALSSYSPAKLSELELNYRRHQYMEFEVPVEHAHINKGLVDCVWLAEGYTNHRDGYYCSASRTLMWSDQLAHDNSCALTVDELKSIPENHVFNCNYAGSCYYKRKAVTKDEVVACICFEIKVSKADFHSRNGHNFIGNLNYYVMPYNLYKEVEKEIPGDIGVITYHYKDENKVGRLKQQRLAHYDSVVDFELYNSLLHTFLNKVDKQYTKARRQAAEQYAKVCSNAYDVILDLLKRLQNEGNYTCYEDDGFGGCEHSNFKDAEHCKPDCPWSFTYRSKLLEKVTNKGENNNIIL